MPGPQPQGTPKVIVTLWCNLWCDWHIRTPRQDAIRNTINSIRLTFSITIQTLPQPLVFNRNNRLSTFHQEVCLWLAIMYIREAVQNRSQMRVLGKPLYPPPPWTIKISPEFTWPSLSFGQEIPNRDPLSWNIDQKELETEEPLSAKVSIPTLRRK